MRIPTCLLLFVLLTTPAVADTWISTTNSELKFIANVAGEDLPGTFKNFRVELTTDQDAALVGFIVSIDLTAAELGDSETNATLFSDVWFNTDKFPRAVFNSLELVKTTANMFEVNGALYLKGSKNTLSFPIEYQNKGDFASISGSTAINRSDFNVGTGEWSSEDTVGLMVALTFDVKLERVR